MSKPAKVPKVKKTPAGKISETVEECENLPKSDPIPIPAKKPRVSSKKTADQGRIDSNVNRQF